MAIIAFWSAENKQAGQTLSMAAVATYMCVEHNYKTLMVNATFQDETLEQCFWNVKKTNTAVKKFNSGKLDIASGAEGLLSAVSSNKATPEIISSYTKVVFKNRLDVLPGIKTTSKQDFERSLSLYTNLLNTANKCYDFVFVDLPKGLDSEAVLSVLKSASIVVYVMPPNLNIVEKFVELQQTNEILQKKNLIPLLARADSNSKYNAKNIGKFIGQKKGVVNAPYNTQFMEAACEAQVANFFLQTRVNEAAMDRNSVFLKEILEVDKSIIYRLQELQYLA